MVTGDNLITARAIAMECGIIEPTNYDSLVMNGLDFINLVGGSKNYIIYSRLQKL